MNEDEQISKEELILELVLSLNKGGAYWETTVPHAIKQYEQLISYGIITEAE